MPAITFAIANQKGGVGKTTTTVSLGHALALMGIPTLIVDMDPQANATSCLGLTKKSGYGIYEPLLDGSDVASRVVSSRRSNLWIVPSELDLAAAELGDRIHFEAVAYHRALEAELVPEEARDRRLAHRRGYAGIERFKDHCARAKAHRR